MPGVYVRKIFLDSRGVGLGLAIMLVTLLVVGLLAGYWILSMWRLMPKSVMVLQGEPVVSGGVLYITVKNVGTDHVKIYKVVIDGSEASFTIEGVEGKVDAQARDLGPGAVALIKVSGLSPSGQTVNFVIITSAGTIKGTATVG